MTTLSIIVDEETSQRLKRVIKNKQTTISEFGREAINKHLDDIIVQELIMAQKEPSLEGDLDELASLI